MQSAIDSRKQIVPGATPLLLSLDFLRALEAVLDIRRMQLHCNLLNVSVPVSLRARHIVLDLIDFAPSVFLLSRSFVCILPVGRSCAYS